MEIEVLSRNEVWDSKKSLELKSEQYEVKTYWFVILYLND